MYLGSGKFGYKISKCTNFELRQVTLYFRQIDDGPEHICIPQGVKRIWSIWKLNVKDIQLIGEFSTCKSCKFFVGKFKITCNVNHTIIYVIKL